jgi:hypothetical protein
VIINLIFEKKHLDIKIKIFIFSDLNINKSVIYNLNSESIRKVEGASEEGGGGGTTYYLPNLSVV